MNQNHSECQKCQFWCEHFNNKAGVNGNAEKKLFKQLTKYNLIVMWKLVLKYGTQFNLREKPPL